MSEPEMTLVKFLRTGRFEKLALNMTVMEVVNNLGFPTGFNTRTFPQELARLKAIGHLGLTYDCLDLTFEPSDENLTAIHIRSLKKRGLPSAIDNGWLNLIVDFNPLSFKTFTEKHHLQVSRMRYLHDGQDFDQPYVTILFRESLVTTVFASDEADSIIEYMGIGNYSYVSPHLESW